MATVIYLANPPYLPAAQGAIERTFGRNVSILPIELLDLLSDIESPLEILKRIVSTTKDVVALVADTPLPIMEQLMVHRFDLQLPLFAPVYNLDENGWPRTKRLHNGKEVLDLFHFEELTQLLVQHYEPRRVGNVSL